MFVLELRASDVHAVLGRLLDQTRVAGLKLMAVNAKAEAGEYRIRASIEKETGADGPHSQGGSDSEENSSQFHLRQMSA